MDPHKPKIKDFFNYIYERQLIWYKKETLKLPAPWTNDPILSKYKFCCNYRELDRCSQHLINKVINNGLICLEEKILNILLYRRFNTPDFFDLYGVQTFQNFNPKWLEYKMDLEKSKGKRLFNDAYIICQRFYIDKYRKSDKHVQQVLMLRDLNVLTILKDIQQISDYKDVHKYLVDNTPLTGGFLAQQYLVDITYTKEFKDKWDINSFVDVGPGAIGAIDLLFPNNEKSYEDCCKELYILQPQYLKDNWKKIRYKSSIFNNGFLRLSDIQNCLCEFRKFCHLQTNSKKRKRYYKRSEENGL